MLLSRTGFAPVHSAYRSACTDGASPSSLQQNNHCTNIVTAMVLGLHEVWAAAIVHQVLHYFGECPAHLQTLAHMIDGLLRCLELEDSVTAKNQELIVLLQLASDDVRHGDNLLCVEWQVIPCLVVEVARGAREVEAPH